MRRFGLLAIAIPILFFSVVHPCMSGEPDEAFAAWIKELRVEALAAGVSKDTLDAALADIKTPLPEVIARDRNQPEFTQSADRYIADRVSEKRIFNGRRMMGRYQTWLGRVERKYDVQRRFIVALWGIESNYGEHTGQFPVIQSLVTLARDDRRGDYFRRELIEALLILDSGLVRPDLFKGSWAGALGQCQFMPSSFRRFAVNADGGRLDIWTSVPDVLASIGNYLDRAGWKDDQTWGRPVKAPRNLDRSLVGLETRLTLSRWQELGVRRIDGTALPRRNLSASLVMPDGPRGQAYLVYDNFRALMSWNRSVSFAIAVGTLSDRLVEKQTRRVSDNKADKLLFGLSLLYSLGNLSGR